MGSGFLLRRIRPAFLSPKNRSVFRHSELVTKAIAELLAYGCIVEHSVPPFCVNLLTVAEGEKLRSVTDLRRVSNYLVKFRLKFEDLRFLFLILEEGHLFFTRDLKSVYHQVDICSEHQAFLGFAWSIGGVLKYFTFSVLPFGLSSACYCFIKLLCPLMKHWRSKGHTLLCILTTVLQVNKISVLLSRPYGFKRKS